MWAKPRLCPDFWVSLKCQRWQIARAAHVICLMIFEQGLFSAPVISMDVFRRLPRAVIHVVKFGMGSYASLSFVWWYAGTWSSVSATCCWSSWSQSHVTRPSRSPCCRAWAETQTRTVITHDQDVITHFCGLLGDGSAGMAAQILFLLSHLCHESHGNLQRMQLHERGDHAVDRFKRTNVQLIKICKTLYLVLLY